LFGRQFDGIITRAHGDSKPSEDPGRQRPGGAQNVLVILIDDCGFG